MVSVTFFNYNNFPIKQNFQSKEQWLRTFVHNVRISRWIFLNLPDLPWVVCRPLSLDLAFVISQKLMGIHPGVSKKDKPDNASSRSIKKFFSVSNEKVDGGEAVQNKRMEADLDGEVENKLKKNYLLFLLHTFWLYCLLFYRGFPLLCIKGMLHVSFK